MRKTDAAEAILSLTTSRDHAASIAGEHRRRNRAHYGLRDDESRIGKSIQKISALEVGADRLDRVFIRRGVRRRRALEDFGLVLIVEPEHRAPRENRAAGFQVLDCGCGIRLKMEDRDAIDQREDTALAAENAAVKFGVAALMEQRGDELERSSTIGTAEHIQSVDTHPMNLSQVR